MRIGITGVHGTGKTTLVEALATEPKFKGYRILTNMTRMLKNVLPINQEGNDITQRYISNQHLAFLSMYDNFISDRTVLDTFAYTEYQHNNYKLNYETYAYCKEVYEFGIHKYDFIFYVEPEFELKGDGV